KQVGTEIVNRTISQSIGVNAGDVPQVTIGLKTHIKVDDGRGGTKWDWGSLVVKRPEAHDFWGLNAWYIRA
ncbi:MAG: hypothetical protein JSW10_07230, partial [Pseudomonadota bacterium]